MKIYLLSNNPRMTSMWKFFFMNNPEITVICDEFNKFMRQHEVDCVVSPANSFGLMDGGYDLAITAWFGEYLQRKVQKYILDNLCGEQPVGTSIIVDADMNQMKLIHTPTMRTPAAIKDPLVVYSCMRTCLMTAIENKVESIVIPAFGDGYGLLAEEVVAQMMFKAYQQIMNPPSSIDWDYALEWDPDEIQKYNGGF